MKRTITNYGKRALAASLLVCALFTVAWAASKISYGGGSVTISSAGNIAVTPKSGGTVAIGGGAGIKKVLSGTASLDFGATAAGACDVLTLTVTGAADGDPVVLGVPHALSNADAYQSFDAWVSTTNAVTVRRCNLTNATTALSNPAAATVRVTVISY